MLTAFAYARVSTKEQAAKDNSIPEQFSRIERFAQENGIKILHTYTDSDSAFHDENRLQFYAMIDDAIKQRPSMILVDDSSRFARNRYAAIETKQTLRKHGVNIRFVNEPYVDPKSVAGLWLEGIQEIKNEATSREIAFHVMKGMSRNLQNRDSQTGWCFKNGGRPPYGYKALYVNAGKDPQGKPIMKATWEIDEQTSSIVHEVIVSMYTQQRMSYKRICEALNARAIPSPKGDYWSVGTVNDMLREHRLEQYMGTAFWNKEEKRDTTGKFKPREEWIIVENAHPAILTPDELKAALQRRAESRKTAVYGATRESQYLLTGLNFENKPFFTCQHCGGNVIGYGNSGTKWSKYICGVHRMKGTHACSSNWRIDREWIEQTLIAEIQQRYTAPERVDEMIKDIVSSSKRNRERDQSVQQIQAQLKTCNTEIKNLLDAIKKGVDPSLVYEEINNLKEQRETLESQIEATKSIRSDEQRMDTELLRSFFTNFSVAFQNATITEKRDLIRTFVRHIELVPEKHEIRIEFYPDHIVQTIGGGEPWQGRSTMSTI